ncbi:helix-turn-helix domain-containing protein [Sphingomonas sp. BK580]|uniref:winged helix-turn-helix transcriptional regulator n=1 Tax=Sphingomonas sp. BK580 TaxID=2586972 RepID=UPI0016169970|nr:helix-turn-helix domain-containing protein [Sphingomonas sp. BK580]MBB3695583.1 DNA-binding HxlR family transcriptional regulator [Sphingomonas sp. BK580]
MDVTEPAAHMPAERRDTRSCLKITQVLSRIGDKWTVLIIILLRERGYRFNELKRGIDGISQRMLTLTLRNMERDGLVTRTVTPSIPPRVDYELTDIGRSLAGPVKILGDWAFEHLGRIAAAQAMFDARAPGS